MIPPLGLGALNEGRVRIVEDELGDGRNVRTQRQDLSTSRENGIGGDVIAQLDQDLTGDGVSSGAACRQGLDIRTTANLHLGWVGRGRQDTAVINDVTVGRRKRRGVPRSRGSVISPAMADAAHTAGLAR